MVVTTWMLYVFQTPWASVGDQKTYREIENALGSGSKKLVRNQWKKHKNKNATKETYITDKFGLLLALACVLNVE